MTAAELIDRLTALVKEQADIIAVTAEGPEPDVAVEYVQDTRMVIADLQAQINAIRNGGTT